MSKQMSERTPGRTSEPSQRPPADIAATAQLLAEQYPSARTELDHRSAFELLVATVLSAQTTDQRVNVVTAELFSRWPGPEELASADDAEVTALVRPLGMGPTRSARIRALAAQLLERHGGVVPDEQEALEALAGVGRKTALVVRGAWFGADAFAVDTHVMRLAARLGWTHSRDALRVERDVLALRDAARECAADGATGSSATDAGAAGDERASEEATDGDPLTDPLDGTMLSLRLILHGRRVCIARAPRCGDCILAEICPSADVVGTGTVGAGSAGAGSARR